MDEVEVLEVVDVVDVQGSKRVETGEEERTVSVTVARTELVVVLLESDQSANKTTTAPALRPTRNGCAHCNSCNERKDRPSSYDDGGRGDLVKRAGVS